MTSSSSKMGVLHTPLTLAAFYLSQGRFLTYLKASRYRGLRISLELERIKIQPSRAKKESGRLLRRSRPVGNCVWKTRRRLGNPNLHENILRLPLSRGTRPVISGSMDTAFLDHLGD